MQPAPRPVARRARRNPNPSWSSAAEQAAEDLHGIGRGGVGRVHHAQERGVAVNQARAGHVLGEHSRVLETVGVGGAFVAQRVEFGRGHDGRGDPVHVGVGQVGLGVGQAAGRLGRVAQGRQVLPVEPGHVVPGQEVADRIGRVGGAAHGRVGRRVEQQLGGQRDLPVAGSQGQAGRQRRPGRVARHADRLPRPLPAAPAEHVLGVVQPGRERVLGGQPVADRHHPGAGHVGHPAGQRVVGLHVADGPAAAVQVDDRAAARLARLEDPHRHPAGRVPVRPRRHRLGHELRAAAAQRQRAVVLPGLRRVVADERQQSFGLERVEDRAELRIKRHRSGLPAGCHREGIRHTGRMTSTVAPKVPDGAAPGDPRDPRGLRTGAPLFDAWLRAGAASGGDAGRMSIPGHKWRTDLTGAVVAGDIPLYAGLDSVKQANGLLADAEHRAAGLWGADWCRFSVAGSTHGNQALALAVGQPGDEVIVSRTLHRSLLLGLVLAGLHPVWVRPDVDPASGLPRAVPVAAVRAALAAHPAARAVFLGDPSYVGTTGDLAGHAAAAHQAGVPLIVDAAWAAHLGFHPGFPPHALAAGADAMVTSAHKALPAWTQGALVLARTDRLDPARLERAFDATHTTSPSGTILASIDAARELLARDGEALSGRLLAAVASARARLAEVPGVAVLDGPEGETGKLVVLLAGAGAHGHAVEAGLIAAGMPGEMADRDTIVPIVTLADEPEHVAQFAETLAASIGRHRSAPRPPAPGLAWGLEPQVMLPPRDAFFAAHETVPAEAAPGRVSAELVAPYPPGVPVLAPGELVTAEIVAALRAVLADGGRVAYAADPTLATVQVVAGALTPGRVSR